MAILARAEISREYTMSLAQVSGRESGSSPRSLATPIVFVVDDDFFLRQSIDLLIRSAGWQPKTFASAEEFLACPPAGVPNCLVLELSLPDFAGLDVQKRVGLERPHMPVIFTTHQKPLHDEVLLSAIQEALERSQRSLGQAVEMQALKERYTSLTLREQQVMILVVTGLLNKQIGGELGISEITVKAHRGKVMLKMKANSLPDLVRMATRLRLPPVASS